MAWRIDNLPWGWMLGSFCSSSSSRNEPWWQGQLADVKCFSCAPSCWRKKCQDTETIKKNLTLETFAVFCSLGVFPQNQEKREVGWFLQQLVWQRPLGLSRAPMDSRRCLRWLSVHSSPAWLSCGARCTQLTNSRAPLVWRESDLNSDTLA